MIAINAGRSWEAKIWSCYHDYSQCWFLLQVHGGLHQPPGDARGQEQVYHCLGHLCQCTHSTLRPNCYAQTYNQTPKQTNRDYLFIKLFAEIVIYITESDIYFNTVSGESGTEMLHKKEWSVYTLSLIHIWRCRRRG